MSYAVTFGTIRIIPADAWSTLLAAKPISTGEDHPRGCGEHTAELTASALNEGSSPRMRGAQFMARFLPLTLGIIPADAGSTPRRRGRCIRRPDHPRGCGEHVFGAFGSRDTRGSSPRMRGERGREW